MILRNLLLGLSIAAAATAAHPQLHRHNRRENGGVSTDIRYDYVVVGSGPGGGPLASRLAIAGHKVLLLEAGGDYSSNINVTVPALNLNSAEDPELKWSYFVRHYSDLERQRQDSKMVWRTIDDGIYVGKYPPSGADPLGILYPRTGALGGCAEHNALITVYPEDKDWANIQALTGDASWAPDNMRGYFEKLERNQYLSAGASGHGFNGWLRTSVTDLGLVVGDAKIVSLVLAATTAMGQGILGGLLATVTGLGKVLLNDLNANQPSRDQTQGVFQVPLAVDETSSSRSSPRDFIIDTANAINSDGSRKYHLDIQLHTLATKIRFDTAGNTPKAIGVEFLRGKRLYSADPRYSSADEGTPGYVAAGKEVIISAGTFNTPQLLKLSGVGPKEELESFGIDIVADLPGVGINMQDRYEVGVVGQGISKFDISKDCNFGFANESDPCLQRWESGTDTITRGPYSTSGAALAIILKSSVMEATDDTDLFILGTPGEFAGFYPGYAYDAVIRGDRWTWLALKGHAHNTAGTVKLRSLDPRDMPNITFNYFDTGLTTDDVDQKDLQALYEGLSWGRKAYNDVIPLDGAFTEILPGSNVSSEADVKQYIKDEAWGHHACCTAAIGADNDTNAVLDTNFRVRGIDSLRVVDASSFPKIPGFFISLPLYILSEKAADVIVNGN